MNRKVFLGCGGIVAFLAAGIVAAVVLLAPRAFEKAKGFVGGVIAEGQRIAAFEKAWRPPSPAPDAEWFPAAVAEWQREKTSTAPGLPELNIQREGIGALYKKGGDEMTVVVVAANDLEKEALFTRAKDALENAGSKSGSINGGSGSLNYKTSSGHVTMSSGSRLYVRAGGWQTRLWWLKGWLFIFRTQGGEDPEAFMQQYLEAMQGGAVEAR